VPSMARRCMVILENRGALRRVQGQGNVPPAFASARLIATLSNVTDELDWPYQHTLDAERIGSVSGTTR
jgi:hypothetical protein